MTPGAYKDKVLEALSAAATPVSEGVINGAPKTYDAYMHQVGYLRGVAHAAEAVHRVYAEMFSVRDVSDTDKPKGEQRGRY